MSRSRTASISPSSVRFAGLVGIASVIVVACGGSTPAPVAAAPSHECPTSGARQCTSATDCGPELHCTGGRCFANQAGCACSETTDCGPSAHCTKGMCHGNQVGVPCSNTEECGANAHCSGGDCYANKAGSPCSETSDCGAGSSCVSGTCN